ncbi:MAG TPA: archaemetzincin family Zn-dependent metalloprotease [Terriglobales bacterium]
MKPLQLLPVGEIDGELLQFLRSALQQSLRIPCEIVPRVLDPAPTLHAERRQYHSSEILRRMQGFVRDQCWRLLGVCDVDLYIPILTFVFGEAQMSGPCAVVSAWRLRQEFYSLPPDQDLFRQRLLKESVHELGHTCGLTHCSNYQCAMASSHGVEWIDLKESLFCPECAARFAELVTASRPVVPKRQ